ncbi:MAG TPA: NAD(P)/FAD-dependent oxidoreductase [Methylomirabilota bacterium]|nr:NAD(P)/FAD-dependent oxidoreductase [Methylomirabilota bacterium]
MSLPGGTPAEPLPVDADFDVTIIGAGPVGLFAAFYAGLRTMKVKLVDSLAEAGGQLAALYPDKYIYDVGGFPKVKARALVDDLVAQAMQYSPTVCLGEQATTLTPADGGWLLGTDQGRQHRTKTILLTAGIGYFAPRKLTDAALARFEGHGLHYVLPGLEAFRDRRVLLLGGGDTAVDWALHLEPLASELTLIHRRDQFRAHEDSVQKLHASRCKVVPFHELKTLEGDGRVERAIIYDNRTKAETTMSVDDVVVNFGFVANLGPLKTWGLTIKANSLEVSQKMETNLPGVFAAGDLVSYPGKLKLIATGFGEAAMAVCGAKLIVDPKARYFPGHSSEMEGAQPGEAAKAGAAEA